MFFFFFCQGIEDGCKVESVYGVYLLLLRERKGGFNVYYQPPNSKHVDFSGATPRCKRLEYADYSVQSNRCLSNFGERALPVSILT